MKSALAPSGRDSGDDPSPPVRDYVQSDQPNISSPSPDPLRLRLDDSDIQGSLGLSESPLAVFAPAPDESYGFRLLMDG